MVTSLELRDRVNLNPSSALDSTYPLVKRNAVGMQVVKDHIANSNTDVATVHADCLAPVVTTAHDEVVAARTSDFNTLSLAASSLELPDTFGPLVALEYIVALCGCCRHHFARITFGLHRFTYTPFRLLLCVSSAPVPAKYRLVKQTWPPSPHSS